MSADKELLSIGNLRDLAAGHKALIERRLPRRWQQAFRPCFERLKA
jgi:hypothetical protein